MGSLRIVRSWVSVLYFASAASARFSNPRPSASVAGAADHGVLWPALAAAAAGRDRRGDRPDARDRIDPTPGQVKNGAEVRGDVGAFGQVVRQFRWQAGRVKTHAPSGLLVCCLGSCPGPNEQECWLESEDTIEGSCLSIPTVA